MTHKDPQAGMPEPCRWCWKLPVRAALPTSTLLNIAALVCMQAAHQKTAGLLRANLVLEKAHKACAACSAWT
jgi:hypothetical protein